MTDNKAWTSLEDAVSQSIGLASVCWREYEGERVFDSELASKAGDDLLAFIRQGTLDPTRSKGEAIVADCLAKDEPFFVFRGRDIFSTMVLKQYLVQLEAFGPDDPEFHMGIINCIADFRRWQTQNVSDVRYPD